MYACIACVPMNLLPPVSACQSEKQLTMQTYVTLRILQMILFMFNVQHRYLLSSLKHDASSDFT